MVWLDGLGEGREGGAPGGRSRHLGQGLPGVNRGESLFMMNTHLAVLGLFSVYSEVFQHDATHYSMVPEDLKHNDDLK